MFKKIGLALVLIASFNAFADSSKPVCQGTEIAPELRGTYEYHDQENSVNATMEIGKDSITYKLKTKPGQIESTEKAWTCLSDGVLVLVFDFTPNVKDSDEPYENRILLKTGDTLIDIGEVDPPSGNDGKMGQQLVNLLNKSHDFTIMKKKN